MVLNIEDMDRLVYLSVPQLNCDASEIALVKKTASADSRSFDSSIMFLGAEGEERGIIEKADLPKYSPDGKMLAYLHAEGTEQQLWLRDDKGDRCLVKLIHGVSDFSWAPDGKFLVFTARLWDSELECPFGEMTPAEKKLWQKKQDDEPVVVEELIYKLDEVGIFDGSRSQIGIVGLEGEARILTRGGFEHTMPAVSVDGKYIFYWGTPYGSTHRLSQQLMMLSLGGELPCAPVEDDALWPCDFIPEGDGVIVLARQNLLEACQSPLQDPLDSDKIAVLSYVKTESGYPMLPQLINVKTGEKQGLFEIGCPCEEINNAIVGRNAVGREGNIFTFSPDGTKLYFTSVWMGSQRLYEYDRIEKSFRELTGSGISVQSFSAPVNGISAALAGNVSRPAELCLINCDTAQTGNTLTDCNAWLREYELPEPVEMNVKSTDGKADIHGWYILPKNAPSDGTVPAVIDVHGGPDCSYSANFWFEFQYLASHGLAVAYCDPRGSVGYGSEFHSGDCAYGGEAACDIMAYLDAVCSIGNLDRAHCGVTGGSYGGYMTNYLITNTDRFAAAVTQRTLANLATSYGTGDMGFVTGKTPEPMSRMFKNRATSRSTAVRLVDKINTPLLLLHGVKDYRCSFEQSEQLYIAMKERRPDVPVRFAAFPGQNHGLTRSGQPWAQKAHLKEMADWFVHYLKEEPFLSACTAGPAWKDAAKNKVSAPQKDPTSADKEEN